MPSDKVDLMLSQFSDSQIFGLVALTTIIFLSIRHIVKKIKLYPFKRIQKAVKEINDTSINGKPDPNVARKAITLTVLTTRMVAPSIKRNNSEKYKELLTCTNNLVASWLLTYPEWDGREVAKVVQLLKQWNFKIDMFSDSLLHGKMEEAEDLIVVLPTDRLKDNMYELIDSFKK